MLQWIGGGVNESGRSAKRRACPGGTVGPPCRDRRSLGRRWQSAVVSRRCQNYWTTLVHAPFGRPELEHWASAKPSSFPTHSRQAPFSESTRDLSFPLDDSIFFLQRPLSFCIDGCLQHYHQRLHHCRSVPSIRLLAPTSVDCAKAVVHVRNARRVARSSRIN